VSARESVHLGEQQLDDYADGVLGHAERAIAERHLAACDTCRRAVDETRAVLAWATGERAAVRAPAELWPLVASRTIHLAEVRRAVLRSMRGLLLVGAIVLVAATALVTWKVARWSVGRDVAPSVEPRATGGARGHVVPPTPPVPPEAPVAPRPPRP
jgi:predicted anti-sigma-YlaC factor YlaD